VEWAAWVEWTTKLHHDSYSIRTRRPATKKGTNETGYPSAISLDKLNFPLGNRDHIQGFIDALITLLEYGDYECPACGQAYPIVKAVQRNLGNNLCFAFRNFPLTTMHPHAEQAAEAAEAAGAQGSFWEMHDLLFENQDALEDEDLARTRRNCILMSPFYRPAGVRRIFGTHKGRCREPLSKRG
jgi:protein-disulfide isomerase